MAIKKIIIECDYDEDNHLVADVNVTTDIKVPLVDGVNAKVRKFIKDIVNYTDNVSCDCIKIGRVATCKNANTKLCLHCGWNKRCTTKDWRNYQES